MLQGYDSVTASALPAGGDFYLAYVDGRYANYLEVRSRFPNTPVLSVTTGGFNAANLCDCEYGDYNEQQAADGLHRGLWRGIYSNTSQYPKLRSAVGHDFPWFSAEVPVADKPWPHITPGAVATQWAWPGHGSPGNYDISWATTLVPFFTQPLPVPSLPPPLEDEMVTSVQSGTQIHVFDFRGSQPIHWWQDSVGPNAGKWYSEVMVSQAGK